MFDNEWVYEDDVAYQLACEQPEDDGNYHEDCYMDDEQPDEAQEWDDYYGGDNGDHGMYYDQPDPFE
jgi:hypothetical protein